MSAGRRGCFEPGKLWSLWDMLQFYAAPFVQCHRQLALILGAMLSESSRGTTKIALPKKAWDEQRDAAAQMCTVLRDMNLPSSVKSAERLQAAIDNADIRNEDGNEIALFEDKSFDSLRNLIHELHRRLIDDLGSSLCLYLDNTRLPYYENPDNLFGADVKAQSPSAAFEIDEAGKCFAMGRYTASVFHLMRIMEYGIRATARCLGIPDPLKPAERNWGVLLREIKSGIDGKWPTQAIRLSSDGALFESLYVSLDAVRNPWRNATMHVENKYTEEEAEHVFGAVRAFMRKLASRMDEQGQPHA